MTGAPSTAVSRPHHVGRASGCDQEVGCLLSAELQSCNSKIFSPKQMPYLNRKPYRSQPVSFRATGSRHYPPSAAERTVSSSNKRNFILFWYYVPQPGSGGQVSADYLVLSLGAIWTACFYLYYFDLCF